MSTLPSGDGGAQIARAQKEGKLPVNWSASDCKTEAAGTRVYFGSDGVMVPQVTDVEKKETA